MKTLENIKKYKIIYRYKSIKFTTYILGVDELDSLNSFLVTCKLLNIPINNKIHIKIKLEDKDNEKI
jgi:NADH:ubiquinone oxidoreductase subunit C